MPLHIPSMVETVEDQIVLLGSRVALSEAERDALLALLGSNPDWGAVFAGATFNKVSLLLANHLINLPNKLVPFMIRRMFGFMLLGNRQRNQGLFREFGRVAEALNARGIPYSPLKGAYLAPRIYRDVGLRSLNDFDLLAAAGDVVAVGQTLESLGYQMGSYQDEAATVVRAGRAEDLFFRSTVGNVHPYILVSDDPYVRFIGIDVSFDVDPINRNRDAAPAMLQRRRVCDLSGFTAPVLAPADLLIHVCAHLYKEVRAEVYRQVHQDLNLIKFCDVRELLLAEWAHATETDWDALAERVRDLALTEAVAYSFEGTHAIYGEPLCERLLARLGAYQASSSHTPSIRDERFWRSMFPGQDQAPTVSY